MRFLVWLSLVCVFVQDVVAQTNDPIFLNNELVSRSTSQRNILPTVWPQNNCLADSRCYAIVQFDRLLNDEQKAALSEQGIYLHQYIPTNAYLASYDGPSNFQLPLSITQLIPLEPHHKRPVGPLNAGDGSEEGDDYQLLGLPFPGVNPLKLAQSLEERGATIREITDRWVLYQVSADLLPEILASPALQYTESAPITPFPEGDIGRGSSRIPNVNTASGLGYTGEGIAIAIGDDGAVRHLDFHGRLVDHTQYDSGSHAEMTTGMAAGSGNIDPATMGSAPGATIHLFDIATNNHIDWAPLHFEDFGIAITSTSFGEGCGEVYELSTSEIDAQVFENPELAHVFSAGNHGTDPCFNTYSWLGPNANGNYYATITGGRKAGKNVIAVGNVEWNDLLLASSSRGPTPDGRIKPDLSALGQFDRTTGPENSYRFSSGTSAAAPNVAGALALLYEQYLETHSGIYPSSALMKAMVLNTADDVGPAGPDFHYGWGRLNTGRALTALSNNQYFTNSIQNGEQQQFQLSVPAGAQNLRVMLYWHDPAGSVLSSIALVNDLELRLQQPNGQWKLPWVPSSVPNLDSLQRDALPGEDHLNNVEQVFSAQPTAGTYQVQIDGFHVPEGPQTFFVTYSYELSSMEMLSPQAGATYVPGENTMLTWNAVDNGEGFSLEYSANGGQSWANLATDIPAETRSFAWTMPNLQTDELLVRLRRSGQTAVSGHSAVLASVPVFTTEYLHAQTALLSWQPVSGATAYQVYALGDQYMEVVGISTETEYAMPATVGDDYWLSVAPIFANGLSGRRANAQYYEHFGCESNVTLALQFDRYPGETAWYILAADGTIRASGGPYGSASAFSYQEEVICLPPGCFTLVVTDAYSDGMCCANGDGWFRLTDAAGNELASGGDFTNMSYRVFCIDPNAAPPLSLSATVLNGINCVGDNSGIAQASATGGSGVYTYLWSNGNTGSTVGNLGAGTYQVTVSDGTQELSAELTLVAPTSILVTSFSTPATCNDGSINLSISGGEPPYELNWADGSTDWSRQNLTSGNYFILVQDANGCQQTHSVLVPQLNPLQVNLSTIMPSCQNSQGGQISAQVQGGNGSYEYLWSTGDTGSSVLTALPAGTYTVTVTAGNCEAQQTVILENPEVVQVMNASAAPRCADSNDGWIALAVSGGISPYTYNWSDGGTDAHRFNLNADVYIVTVTDALGCTAIRGFPLTGPAELQLSAQVQHVDEASNGAINLLIQGGTAPYEIQWSNGAQTSSIVDLPPGQYVAVVTDFNGCNSNTVVTIDDQSTSETEPVYCPAQGASTSYEWIEAIYHNGSNYTSGNDGGLGDYLALILPMQVGEEQQLELVPGYQSTAYNEFWKVWIDYNHDGDFTDEGEEVAALGPLAGSTQFSFIPPSGLSGQTRLRIAMRYGSSPPVCANLSYGEVEDYTIEWLSQDDGTGQNMNLQISSPTINVDGDTPWRLFPNPARDQVQLNGWSQVEKEVELLLMNQQGQLVRREVISLLAGKNQFPFDLSSEPPGMYQLILIAGDWTQHLRVLKQ